MVILGGTSIYKAEPQSACEYLITTNRGLPFYPVPGADDAEILSIWATPSDQNGFPISSDAVSSYQCAAKVLRIFGPSFNPPTLTFDINNAGWVYPVCNVGDHPSPAITSETICNIPDNIPDPGANLGQPSVCIGNPINAATGNKYAKQTDLASAIGLSFVRYYNSNSLSGSTQIGSGWRHTYQRSLYLNSHTVTAIRADGGMIYFHLSGSSWINQQAGTEVLVPLTDTYGNSVGWQLITGDDTTEHYDTQGKLLAIIDRDGRARTLTYDSNRKLLSVSDDLGRQIVLTYDTAYRIASLTDPAGGLYQYRYDTDNNLAGVTYPDGNIRAYHYNEQAYTSGADLPHALTGITDENGIRYATYTYDEAGRAIATEHAGGADRYSLAYNTEDNSTTIIDALGSEYTHQFQTILGVAKSVGQSQPAGAGCRPAASHTTYDSLGNIASRTDFNGNQTCYAFDLKRNLEIARIEVLPASSTCPPDLSAYAPDANTSQRKILTTWHADFRLPIRVTEATRETSLDYDQHGNVTHYSIRDLASNDSRSWTTNYVYHPDVMGVLIQSIEDGPRKDVADQIIIDYYAPDENCAGGHLGCRGEIANITNALGHVARIIRYNAQGQPETIIDPNGLTITLAYDVRQRLVSRTIGTQTTQYQYDRTGQLSRIIKPDSSFITYIYDDAHRLIQIADRSGNHIRYTLDAKGNSFQEAAFDSTGTLSLIRQRQFDPLNRLWQDKGAQNQITQYGYDPQGNLNQITDPLQHTTLNRFDTLNRLIQTTNPLGGQTQQNVDVLDQITQVANPNGIVTTYTYNGLGDLIREDSPDRGTTTYTHDSAGNVKTRTDARGVVYVYTYDALNRRTSQTHTTVSDVPNTPNISWVYDAGKNGIGRLTGMYDEAGNTTYHYDLHGRLLRKVQTVNDSRSDFIHVLSHRYDSNGRLSQTTYPSGTQIDILYGADGRPTEIRADGQILIHNIAYQPFGQPKSWIWGNGQTHARSFDLDGRLVQYPLGHDTRSLSYDAASHIIHAAETNPAYNQSYSYDPLGRLVRQVNHRHTSQWTFDANGNRTSVQFGGNTYDYTMATDSNRLFSVAGPVVKNYTYDAAGNPLNDGVMDYIWNAAGRLSKASTRNNVSAFLYNGQGERLLKVGGKRSKGGPYFFVYDQAGRLIGEYEKINGPKQNGNWRLRQETVRLNDIPVAVLKKTTPAEPVQIYFIHADHLNTPRLIVDATHTPIWRWNNSDAFGANQPDEDPDGDGKLFIYNLRFAGQYFDKETGLHYNYFRDYDPETGRYLQSDPIGLAGGNNTYNYAASNPLHYIDPTGEIVPIVAACAGNPACIATVSSTIGAVTGAAMDIALQLFSNGGNLQCINSSEVAISAGLSALPFGVVGTLGGKIAGQVGTKYGPHKKGPLADDIAKTFRSGTYIQTSLLENTTLYRVISNNGNPVGKYWTRIVPKGPLQSVIDLALDQNWGNTASRVVQARIPAGTKIFEGVAAQQRGLVGGGNQIYIPKINQKWLQ